MAGFSSIIEGCRNIYCDSPFGWKSDLNRRPTDYESVALPTALFQHIEKMTFSNRIKLYQIPAVWQVFFLPFKIIYIEGHLHYTDRVVDTERIWKEFTR